MAGPRLRAADARRAAELDARATLAMTWCDRLGLYGAYFGGMAGIGFTLPYLSVYLKQQGLTDRQIGVVATVAALAGLVQFPVGIWSDRLGARKPFLIAALGVVAAATWLLPGGRGLAWLGALVVLFAENGPARAVIESLAGAEAAALAPPGRVAGALGALRFWKPIGIVLTALAGSVLADRHGVGSILVPLAIVQTAAAALALLIGSGPRRAVEPVEPPPPAGGGDPVPGRRPSIFADRPLVAFLAAVVLYHAANAPGGVYLSLFLRDDLHAPERLLAYAFAVSMVAWMAVVWPAGRLADRLGRKPLLIAGWAIMTLRLGLVALIHEPGWAVANQALDGLGNGLFAVLAAAWLTDRLADPRRSGEAQVIVGSCLVLGSALGPFAAGYLVGPLGYRGLFLALAGVGALGTILLAAAVPEALPRRGPGDARTPMATTSDLSTTP